MRRQHGCQAPWRPAQVIALVAWFSTLAGFYSLFIPIISSAAWQAAAIVLYSVAAIAVFCTYLVVSLTDPSDLSSDGPLYCDHCQCFVQHGSRHCKECLKCVQGFDHHCKWVNNCIGSKNYRPFLVLLTSICSMLAVQLAAGVDLLVQCFTASEAISARLDAAYPAYVTRNSYIAALCCYLAVIIIPLYALGDLWLLHLVLLARGMTTWDYIMASRDAATAAAASTSVPASGRVGEEPQSLMARSLRQIRSLGHSNQIRDESLIFGNSISHSSSGKLLLVQHKHHRVSLTPCQACLTPESAARQHAATYQRSNGNSTQQGPAPAQFDAALIYSPRPPGQQAELANSAQSQQLGIVGGSDSNASLQAGGGDVLLADPPLHAAAAAAAGARRHSMAEARMAASGKAAVRFSL